MADLPETHLIFEKLGDINATLREVKHVTNNNSSKIDGLTIAVATQSEIIRRVEILDKGHAEHHLRIAVLEADRHRREGAIGLVAWVSRHWPFTILGAMIIAASAWFNGKLS